MTSARTITSQSASPPGLKYSDYIFNYTQGRFLCNESHELSHRHVRFDVNELGRLAAEAVGARSCVSVGKYPDSMKIADQFAVVKAIAGYQNVSTLVSFHKFGGLYYRKDLENETRDEPLYVDASGVEVTNTNFAIGPGKTLNEYHIAIGHCEIACTNQLLHLPQSPITICGPGTYQSSRERKPKALDCYLKLIKFLLPSDQTISSSHLWHSDLHVANIFVNPSKPTEIVSLIDWQSTELYTLYYHAR